MIGGKITQLQRHFRFSLGRLPHAVPKGRNSIQRLLSIYLYRKYNHPTEIRVRIAAESENENRKMIITNRIR